MKVIELRLRENVLCIEVEIYGTVYVVPFAEWLKLLAETAEKANLYLAEQIKNGKGSDHAR